MSMLKFKTKVKNSCSLVQWKYENFKQDIAGVAAIEFAFLAPLMLLMYVGTIEVSSAVSANRKLSRSASAIGDLITQVSCVDDDTMNDIVKIANNILKPYDTRTFEILLSSIEIEADGSTSVDWSRKFGGDGTGLAAGSSYTLPSQITTSEGYVVAAKIKMSYTPTFGWAHYKDTTSISFDQTAIEMDEELFLRPRVGDRVARGC